MRPTLGLAIVVGAIAYTGGQSRVPSFTKDVEPIFVKRCVACHSGPSSAAKLDLSTRAGIEKGGASGPLYLTGKPDASLLIWRVEASHGQGIMPPNPPSLSAADKTVLRQWVQGGAKFDSRVLDYAKDVAPLFKAFCSTCHQGAKPAANLDLTQVDWVKSKRVVVGDPDHSLLMDRLLGRNGLARMPKGFKPLDASQIQIIHDWIAQGAHQSTSGSSNHWAYLPVKRPSVPNVSPSAWCSNPVDNFILSGLKQANLKPNPVADDETLVRRMYLDVIGIPPTPEEVDRVLAMPKTTRWNTLIDQLFKSPHYGERQARGWLDLARYADSQGFEADRSRVMWPYRDWVIKAFNANMPFDQFTIRQLAGDLLDQPTIDDLIATGFHRNTMMNEEGGVDPEMQYFDVLVDRVSTTGTVWLGSTVGCARCHDHKFDPFTQKDFYQMMAYFSTGEYEVRGDASVGQQRWYEPEILAPTEGQTTRIAELETIGRRINDRLVAIEQTSEFKAALNDWKQAAQQSTWAKLPSAVWQTSTDAKIDTLENGDLWVNGPNPPKDTLLVSFTSDREITGIRLTAVPDDRLANKGSGRSGGGNFVLTGLNVLWASNALPIQDIASDFTQDGFDPREVPKHNLDSGWAIYPNVSTPHELILKLRAPIPANQPVRLQLEFQSNYDQHVIGRFRLETTNHSNPMSLLIAPKVRALLAKQNLSADEQKELDSAFASRWPRTAVITQDLLQNRQELGQVRAAIPSVKIMREKKVAAKETFIRTRGEFQNKADKVQSDPPAFLMTTQVKPGGDRLTLAKWLVDPANPLTARVVVNRIWEQYFGTGLVKTSEDFGTQGAPCTNQPLLDWLASELVRQHWDIQAIQRLVLTSTTYRLSSTVRSDLLAKDPENAYLARGPRIRLEAEMVRDTVLRAGGILSEKMYGPSVYPDQPAGVWDNPFGEDWMPSSGDDRYRRGLYTFWKRSAPYPMFVSFDATSREQCTPRRYRTNTPLQALTMLNDTTAISAAKGLAKLMLAKADRSLGDGLTYGFRRCTGRKPTASELNRLQTLLAQLQKKYITQTELAKKLDPDPRMAAWIMVGNTLLNLDETITKE